ncbi:MAG: hypothetical protein A2Y82_03880 [Candidatus Buchananbacteria bacterium RBG_13_36_9]|uniref:Uncharacterized protein n=1 Tax=Candidatus Buchananbacteria bacterium RBG_13_36_9 TaxID=1797530 RepID=A0A1G1XMX7_9BACT|nr:MAG: hypothetical protein A2Y82_03880 [Candidatus Buchananbacteria bacterium RBG_13_36_9]
MPPKNHPLTQKETPYECIYGKNHREVNHGHKKEESRPGRKKRSKLKKRRKARLRWSFNSIEA